MTRRPRPPPVTFRVPRPLTPNRCTDTSWKSPAPESLKLPPPPSAKLWQLNDQRCASDPAHRTALPPARRCPASATGHPAPAGPWSRSVGLGLARWRQPRPPRPVAPHLWLVPDRPAAATARSSPRPGPPQAPRWRPRRPTKTGGTRAAAATPTRPPLRAALPYCISESACPQSIANRRNRSLPPTWADDEARSQRSQHPSLAQPSARRTPTCEAGRAASLPKAMTITTWDVEVVCGVDALCLSAWSALRRQTAGGQCAGTVGEAWVADPALRWGRGRPRPRWYAFPGDITSFG